MDDRIKKFLEDRGRAEEITIGRSDSQVLRSGNLFLKIAPAGKLARAAAMQEYFHAKGLTAPLIAYDRDDRMDYLLAEAVPGKSGIEWTDRPEWLAGRLGECVRMLHSLDARDCPVKDVNEQALRLYARETGYAYEGEASVLKKDALLHGDCCLPNVFFSDKGFAGFIDLGEGGLGDRHFDLYWAVWSLEYNLKTDRYTERFLDAYGRDAMDAARMDCCARLSRCDE